MFNKASLAFLVALAVGATASPTIAPVVAREATVALRNRDNGTTPDGVFDKDKVLQSIAKTSHKHQQNLKNLEKNKGPHALPKGAAVNPRAAVSSDVEARMQRRQAEALTDQGGAEWTGTVFIGTPGQPFLIDFDTGSADLWVPSSTCKSYACGFKSTYKASNSVTSVKKAEKFSVTYGDGLTVSGPTYTDDVTVAGIEVTKQWFSAVTTISDNFASDPADGILGLAFPAISQLNQSPFFITAHTEKKVKKNQFGFVLGTSGSELYLGGTDTTKYKGGLEFHPIDSSSGFWLVPGASAKVNNAVAIAGFETVIDSGTTLMYAPFNDAAAVYAQMPGGAVFDAANGLFEYTCNPQPKVAFNWGGKDWVVSSALFNLGKATKGSTKCIGALIGQAPLGNAWILGDKFMQNVYTAFDFDKEAVGFAALA
ncbi:Acid protease [Mycena sanguinolenta]|uniref:Acid protease n=1 Tax=Mycena sanguinolenta TaxID=230812 RepID=A0A8H6XK05_9AGAR|nr:Acid protease [Mycena sanguinolenta]